MGGGRIDSASMRNYYARKDNDDSWSRATNAHQIYRESRMRDELNPAKMKLPREACDSALSPHSRGIIFGEDLTGSMDEVLLDLIKNQFPSLISNTYDSVSFDPHIMFMGFTDVAARDEAPLQVTQFETDLRIVDQLQKIYIERGAGGGNSFESYILPWYFAAKHIKMDCFEKRGEKGFLFTFGDEKHTPYITRREIREVFGDQDYLQEEMLTAKDCLEQASEKFHCYHIIIHGWYYKNADRAGLISGWRNLMGTHVCDLSDHRFMPELVATIFKMYEGMSKTEALNKIQNPEAKRVVRDALKWHEEHVSDVPAGNKASAEAEYEVF